MLPTHLNRIAQVASIIVIVAMCAAANSATVAFFDFRQGDNGWMNSGPDHIADLAYSDTDGMSYTIVGEDPYVWSPPADYPAGEPVRLTFRMRVSGVTGGQVFYGASFNPTDVVDFAINDDGAWHTYQFDLPALGAGAALRIDTGGFSGEVDILWVRTEAEIPAQTLAYWDFTQEQYGWSGNFDVANEQITAQGYEFDSTGGDPWIEGETFADPDGFAVRISVRLSMTASGSLEWFWGESGFSASRSAQASIPPDGQFHEVSVVLPVLNGAQMLRFDPGTGPGHVVLQWMEVETVVPVDGPPFNAPVRPTAGALEPFQLASGPLTLTHYRERFGGFILSSDGVEMASGQTNGRLGYFEGGLSTFKELDTLTPTVTLDAGVLTEELTFADGLGGNWTARRTYTAGTRPGTIDVAASVSCDAAREFTHFPWMNLFCGLGTFGTSKTQAILPGLEYLADEPSSSMADLTTDEHIRRVPAPHKLTFPLVTLAHQDRYIGMVWQLSDDVAIVHDTPDRIFGSGASLMGLWFPNVGHLRRENDFYAGAGRALAAGEAVTAAIQFIGGSGASCVPAVQHYVDLRGLPPLPEYAGGFDAAVELLAAGWTDSDCYDGAGQWRHAVWPGFGSQIAADACVYTLWLAKHSQVPATANQLRQASNAGIALLPGADPQYASSVSHVAWPVAPFIIGNLPGHLNLKRSWGYGALTHFDAQGIRTYDPGSGNDYGTTHFADHASGYSATALATALEAAYLTGDATLAQQAVEVLDKQTVLYADRVPRGAQTWEIPLHAPDILASGYMVKCYVLGYELTGREDLLDEAEYWAWTGVPFIYLDRSTGGPIGDYATIPVLAGTNWVAPVWIGRPVQWCGLVYRSWIERLADHRPDSIWRQVATGITISGVQQTFELTDAARRGLLPDFFFLDSQVRDGPAINPGTVQAGLGEAYGRGRIFGSKTLARTGWFVHAPSEIRIVRELDDGVVFDVDGWGELETYQVLVARIGDEPEEIRALSSVDGLVTPGSFYDPSRDQLHISGLRGDARITIQQTTAIGAERFDRYE